MAFTNADVEKLVILYHACGILLIGANGQRHLAVSAKALSTNIARTVYSRGNSF